MALLLASCSDEENSATPIGEIVLDHSSLEFSNAGETLEVTVTSNLDWRLSGRKTWCKPSVTEGRSGDKVTFTADPNTGDQERSLTYTFMCGNKAVDLIVTQSKIGAIEPVRDEENIGPEGGILTVRVRTNVDPEVVIPDEATTWLHALPTDESSKGEGGYLYLKFEIDENTTYGDRSAKLTLNGAAETKEVTILQTKNLGLEVPTEPIEVPETGGEITFEVTANVEHVVEMTALAAQFVTRTDLTTRTEGNLTISRYTYTVGANTMMERVFQLSIRSLEGNITKKITIKQAGSMQILATIPDANFRKKLLNEGYITDASSEACELTWEGYSATAFHIGYANIESLEGIEAFANLETLDVSSSRLTKIDVSKLLCLKSLVCNINAISELILGDTQVETIDLNNGLYYSVGWNNIVKPTSCIVSGTHLKQLNIGMSPWYSNYDDLHTLDVSGCPALETLNCVRTGQKLKTLILAEGQEIPNLTKSDFTQIVRK